MSATVASVPSSRKLGLAREQHVFLEVTFKRCAAWTRSPDGAASGCLIIHDMQRELVKAPTQKRKRVEASSSDVQREPETAALAPEGRAFPQRG
ncbi:MAG: hypothetical protein C4334_01060 [Pyrinomonas sp.]